MNVKQKSILLLCPLLLAAGIWLLVLMSRHAQIRSEQRAENARIAAYLDQATAAMEQGDFARCHRIISEAMTQFPQEESFQTLLSDAEARKEAANRQHAADLIYRTRDTLGYEAALIHAARLREEWPEEPLFSYCEQQLKEEYEQYLLSASQDLQQAGEGEAALALLEHGLALFTSDALWEQRAYLLRHTVRYIGSMTFTVDSPFADALALDECALDVQGNRYDHSLSLSQGVLTLPLSGAYETLSGTVACPEGMFSSLYASGATLQIYGDESLLLTFEGINELADPQPFSCPLGGIETLRLVWSCEGANGQKNWGHMATLFDGTLTPCP